MRDVRLLACLFVLASTLSAPVASAASDEIVIRAVPPAGFASIRVDGRRVTEDGEGEVRLQLRSDVRPIEVTTEPSLESRPGPRLRFVRWSDGSMKPSRTLGAGAPDRLTAFFESDFVVRMSFSGTRTNPVDGTVESVTVRDDSGGLLILDPHPPGLAGPTALYWERHPPGTNWLPATRVALRDGRLVERKITYRAVSAFDGEAIPVTSSPFRPADDRRWQITLGARGLNDAGEVSLASRLMLFAFLIALAVAVVFVARRWVRLLRTTTPTLSPQRSPARGAETSKTAGARPATRPEVRGPPAPARQVSSKKPLQARGVSGATSQEQPTRSDRRYVTVQLKDGRTVEGWQSMPVEESLRELVILDVVAVRGSDGDSASPAPSDAFIPRAEILRLSARERSSRRDVHR